MLFRSFMGNTDYSGRDIARTVNNILSMHLNKEIAPPYCVADWTNRSLNPNVTGRNMVRTSELNEMFEEVSLAMKIHQRSISFLHHPVAPGAANIEFNGTVESLEPIGTQTIPFDVSVNIPLYQSYKDYLLGLDAYKLYEAAVSDYELKLAIFVGALTALRDRGHHTDLDVWQTFTLGPRFIESLKSHQCYGTQNFASTCFDVLRHVVARLEKYENSPFCTGADRGKQIVRNGQLAWRTHVTKGMQALRLMSWTTSDGSIELANVGNKNALEIF